MHFESFSKKDFIYNFRYLKDKHLNQSPVLYLCPSVSKICSFALWDECNRMNVLLQTVPQNIFNYFRTGNLGIFEKLDHAFQQTVQKE